MEVKLRPKIKSDSIFSVRLEILGSYMTIDLCIVRTSSRRPTNLDGQTNRRTKASEHIDERIGTEEVDTPAEEIADARLRHAQCLGGSLLFEAASHDKLLYRAHRVRHDY